MKDKNKIIKRIVNALNANDYEAARKIIENDLKRLGCTDEYYFYLALITENLERKRELYTKAIEVNPDFLDAYINRGLVNNELQDYDKSLEDYNRAIELDSRCALAYNNRGYTKYKMKDYKGALDDYNRAILLNPKFQMALDNKAQIFQEVCIKDDEDFVEKYYLSLGIADVNSGAFPDAIRNLDEEAYKNYTKAIELNKKMTDAYFNRGQLIFNTNPKLALDDFVSAVALDPKFIDAYYSIAAIQKNSGQYEDAIKNLDKIIELEPHAVNAKALKKLILTKYLKN